jgi:hypothetical protein
MIWDYIARVVGVLEIAIFVAGCAYAMLDQATK